MDEGKRAEATILEAAVKKVIDEFPRLITSFELRALAEERAHVAKTIERLCAASVNASAAVRAELDATIIKLLGELRE